MTFREQKIGAGFRRYDAAFSAAETSAIAFKGLMAEVSPGKVLAAFKGAAPTLGIPRGLVGLVDLLFRWTQPQDWLPGQEPIVTPSNDRLGQELQLEVRQVQNLLRRAIELRLISMKDSPNGHRGSRRARDGQFLWSYGIDLRPLGTRYGEFQQAILVAREETRRRDNARRSITIARKGLAQIAAAALRDKLSSFDWVGEYELARLATTHARTLRSIENLEAIAVDLEARRNAAAAAYNEAAAQAAAAYLACNDHVDKSNQSVENACIDVSSCIDSTPTDVFKFLNRNTCNAQREERSDPVWQRDDETVVERDLVKHGIDVNFIRSVCSRVCWELSYGRAGWADIIRIADNEVEANFISRQTWHEAIRTMGRQGAAAAFIAIVSKTGPHEVENPGGYLRGMSKRAATGDLKLGRTFHGLKNSDGIAARAYSGAKVPPSKPSSGSVGSVLKTTNLTSGFRPHR